MVFILVAILFGCINIKTNIKLKKDGSGVIEQTFLLSNSVANMMNANQEAAKTDVLSDSTPTEKTPDLSVQMMDKNKLAKYANEMGEGVALVSVSSLIEGEFSGYKAVYSFKDINKLKINQNPAELMPSDASGGSTTTSTEKEFLTFAYVQGVPNSLTINLPALNQSKAKKSDEQGQTEAMDESTVSMMKEIYKDMKISMQIEVPASILKSNVTYKTDTQVTLLDIDFNKILADDKSFNALVKGNAESIEDMKALVKNVKGLRMELQKSVYITF